MVVRRNNIYVYTDTVYMWLSCASQAEHPLAVLKSLQTPTPKMAQSQTLTVFWANKVPPINVSSSF